MYLRNHVTFTAAAAAGALLGSTMLTAPALAQEAQENLGDVIIVTAQKREENLQDVPIAVVALGTQKLQQLQVQDFDDYARFLPSLSYQSFGPGTSTIYFRGVASGENANHSASLPSVGVYLDEQPVTTIQGNLDIHVYDIARVEALAGPQGTLYGASSQAGTVKIVTNRPDTSGFYGAVDAEVNTVAHGDPGYVLEGFINAPLSGNAAIRVVGWYDKDGGYIDNVPGTITFPINQYDEEGDIVDLPGDDISFSNAAFVEDNYNEVETYGARVALQIDLDENWTVLPSIMGQKQKSRGSFWQESGLGDLQVQQYNPERMNDRWFQAALTIEGKIGNWDLTYAGAYMKRKVNTESDYVDYAYFYDALAGYAQYFTDNDGNQVNPNQYIQGIDRFTKQSHELRIASPSNLPLRFIGGVFYQRQSHNIEQNYIIDDIADEITVPGTDSDIWLTKQLRIDRDYAAFGELSYDVTEKLTLTGGIRVYKYKNSLEGFFGYSDGFSSRTGVAACFRDANDDLLPPTVKGSPCTNLDKTTSDTDFIHKLNATYKLTDDALVYATWSRGFRPGGINRRGTLPPYGADTLDNYELGWKTTWAGGLFRWNGAVYYETWKDIQLSFLGANGLTEIRNAGDARIWGIESDIFIRASDGLTFNAGFSYNDAQSTKDFCKFANTSFDCTIPGPDGDDNELLAPSGTRLPVSAKFKGNAFARYEFPVGSLNAHLQGGLVYEGKRTSDLRLLERAIVGSLPSYTTVDVSAGVTFERWSIELYARNLFDSRGQVTRTVQCGETICGDPDGVTAMGGKFYTVVTTPRTIGLKVGTKF